MKRINLQLMNGEYVALKAQAKTAGILPGTLARLFLQAGILTKQLDNRRVLFDAENKNLAGINRDINLRNDKGRCNKVQKKR